MKLKAAWLLSAAFGIVSLALAQTPSSDPKGTDTGPVALIDIQGAIGPATSLYYASADEQAQAMGAELIVLRIDTPGGLDQAMRDIIKRIMASPIPVVAYVAPSGARAASAGTYILYASHVAAMAPATNLGAATPVPIMGDTPETPPLPADTSKEDGEQTAKKPADAMEKKLVNDAVAYIRSLAEKRGRNADWAEEAVRGGDSLSAEMALEKNVIELMATDVSTLLTQLDGRRVEMVDGQEITLKTSGLEVVTIEPDWRERLLGVLTNPAVAYILLLIGIYGLLLEGYNPGAILPGVVGGICLLLALYAFQILPINYVGLALIMLGLCLIVAETFVPSLGVLGIGGVVAFVAGSIMLLDTDIPGYDIPIAIIAAIATAAGLLILISVVLLMRSRRQRIVTGHEAMIGAEAEAIEDFEGEGWVRVHGENWKARSKNAVKQGQLLYVTTIRGLKLEVDTQKPDLGERS